ncbi:hypothetical protein OH491_16220 [Termitidicoccus mucosus]|uniref:Uncharacterized protein n=1 Tax=Termitidicoccus mucosus TaxID=1184151 RepID=A0A178IIT0_9BACT|nr:hypothetical protein AW736_12335 [Opitutaceae bacterium TSB47]
MKPGDHRIGTPPRGSAPHPEWQRALTACVIERLGCATRTGPSWAAGTVGHATFTFRLGGF